MRPSCLTHSGEKTAFMQRRQRLYAQAEYRDLTSDDQGHFGLVQHGVAVKVKRRPKSPIEGDFSEARFMAKAFLIGAAEQTRTECARHLNGCCDQLKGQRVDRTRPNGWGFGGGDGSLRQNPSANPVLECGNVEVDQQSERPPTEAHVGQQLGFMDRQDGVDRLEFQGQPPVDQQVETVTAVQRDTLMTQGIGNWRTCGVPRAVSLILKASSQAISSLPGPSCRCTAMAAPITKPVSLLLSSTIMGRGLIQRKSDKD